MTTHRPSEYTVRPFRRGDRQAVRDICAATCWIGEHRAECVPDDWTWAEFWTRYFTDREPGHTWVVQRAADRRVVGYLTGSADVRRVDAYGRWVVGGVAWHVVRRSLLFQPGARRCLSAMFRSAVGGELDLPADIARDYPGANRCTPSATSSPGRSRSSPGSCGCARAPGPDRAEGEPCPPTGHDLLSGTPENALHFGPRLNV